MQVNFSHPNGYRDPLSDSYPLFAIFCHGPRSSLVTTRSTNAWGYDPPRRAMWAALYYDPLLHRQVVVSYLQDCNTTDVASV